MEGEQSVQSYGYVAFVGSHSVGTTHTHAPYIGLSPSYAPIRHPDTIDF